MKPREVPKDFEFFYAAEKNHAPGYAGLRARCKVLKECDFVRLRHVVGCSDAMMMRDAHELSSVAKA
jgi:hypothetical protein